jgi:hypothetical protein
MTIGNFQGNGLKFNYFFNAPWKPTLRSFVSSEDLWSVVASCLVTLLVLKEKFEDTKEEIRSHKSKKNRQYNVQKKNDNDLQNTTQKTKCWVAWIPLKTGWILEGLGVSAPVCF